MAHVENNIWKVPKNVTTNSSGCPLGNSFSPVNASDELQSYITQVTEMIQEYNEKIAALSNPPPVTLGAIFGPELYQYMLLIQKALIANSGKEVDELKKDMKHNSESISYPYCTNTSIEDAANVAAIAMLLARGA